MKIMHTMGHAVREARTYRKEVGWDSKELTGDGWKGTEGVVEACGCIRMIRHDPCNKERGGTREEIRCPYHKKMEEMKMEAITKTEGKKAAAKGTKLGKNAVTIEDQVKEGKKLVKKDAQAAKEEGYKGNPDPKLVNCPECGIPNSIRNTKCDVCGTGLFKGPIKTKTNGDMKGPAIGKEKTEVVLFELNKKLEVALKSKNKDRADDLRILIKNAVLKTEGAFKQDKDGFAVQAKATKKEPGAPREKKADSIIHICPCCGQQTSNGSMFIPGHDARIKGLMSKVDKGKMKKNDLPALVRKLMDLRDKFPDATIKVLAQKLDGTIK